MKKEQKNKPIFVIDGDQFDSLEGFYEEISASIIPGTHWGKNLDALNDVLRGGFGTPEHGYIIRWVNSERSKHCLGFDETLRQRQKRLKACHPDNRAHIQLDIEAAKRKEGPTVFDELVSIINNHGANGQSSKSQVELILE